jgi:Xaa-Pro dipeptidase
MPSHRAATQESLYIRHLDHLQRGYAQVLEQHGYACAVVLSGQPLRKSSVDDQYWSLRVFAPFGHWLPLQSPGCALVIASGQRPRLLWWQCADFWEGPPQPESLLFADHLKVELFSDTDALLRELPRDNALWLGDERELPADVTADRDRRRAALDDLDELRVRKTPYEVACLAEANARAARGHEVVRRAFASGDCSELELHLLYLQATAQDDPETPYKNIVALGQHAATLHHVAYAKRPGGSPTLLLDAGATVLGYHADITRTWLKGQGAALDVFRGLVAGVEALQIALCQELVAGRNYEDLHDSAHLYIGELLRQLGILRVGPEEAVAKDLTFALFPHGLGHSLGLQTHDVACARVRPRPDNPYLRTTRIIEPGMALTVEPGVYFIDALLQPLRRGPSAQLLNWPLIDALAPLGGVRIEDDLIVTEGPERWRNLTREVLPEGGGEA